MVSFDASVEIAQLIRVRESVDASYQNYGEYKWKSIGFSSFVFFSCVQKIRAKMLTISHSGASVQHFYVAPFSNQVSAM